MTAMPPPIGIREGLTDYLSGDGVAVEWDGYTALVSVKGDGLGSDPVQYLMEETAFEVDLETTTADSRVYAIRL